jgi:hypothetical protein
MPADLHSKALLPSTILAHYRDGDVIAFFAVVGQSHGHLQGETKKAIAVIARRTLDFLCFPGTRELPAGCALRQTARMGKVFSFGLPTLLGKLVSFWTICRLRPLNKLAAQQLVQLMTRNLHAGNGIARQKASALLDWCPGLHFPDDRHMPDGQHLPSRNLDGLKKTVAWSGKAKNASTAMTTTTNLMI